MAREKGRKGLQNEERKSTVKGSRFLEVSTTKGGTLTYRGEGNEEEEKETVERGGERNGH